MVEEPLQLLPVEKWSELEDVFKADWPRSISGFTVLEREKYMLQCGLDYGFKVYCPFGDVNNGMVAMNIKKTFHEVIVQCARDDTSKLEEALKTTNIIDWTKEIEVPFAPKHVMSCVKRVIEYKRLVIHHISTTTTYMLDKTSPLFNVTLPKGFSFDYLSLDHLDLLDSTWPHRYPGSDFYFEILIKCKMGYGLFRDGKLISWVLIKEMGALLHLYTLQEERRKGYGELVLKLMSDVLRKDGKYVVAFCVAGNENAAKLYQKLNFQATGDSDWCTFTGSSQ
ncbi:glycine N-acyltransferase-like protein 3 [Epargyreus clarus]|uniref:glycine N-acyltransferase-like protein 3 n=1 Tax=Epargyreus clarus TaxID=520877 RepID=UPI003C2E42C0